MDGNLIRQAYTAQGCQKVTHFTLRPSRLANCASFRNDGLCREASGATRRATQLADWLRAVLSAFLTGAAPQRRDCPACAALLPPCTQDGEYLAGFPDLTGACIARANGLALAIRNLRHFEPLGVEAMDPFADPMRK
ncbi:MAG: hypothetical protein JOY71_11655 [Acetobacteraceae bacterium]|nr:hypothetical protein [Acetobacteraceae bacterium]